MHPLLPKRTLDHLLASSLILAFFFSLQTCSGDHTALQGGRVVKHACSAITLLGGRGRHCQLGVAASKGEGAAGHETAGGDYHALTTGRLDLTAVHA